MCMGLLSPLLLNVTIQSFMGKENSTTGAGQIWFNLWGELCLEGERKHLYWGPEQHNVRASVGISPRNFA